MEGGGRRRALIIAVLVVSLLPLSFAVASAATGNGVSIQMVASPNQVQEDQNFTITALISNAGKASYQSFNVSIIAPSGWSQDPRGQAPGGALTAAKAAQPGSYDLGPLRANQTDVLEVEVTVASGTLPGSYTIFLLTNPTSPGVGEAQATLAVQVQGTAALPLGGAAVPVSLILILLPGFATIMIVLWSIGRSFDASWQAGLAFTFLSFFAGFVEWYLAGYILASFGPPPHQTLLVTTILNLDLSTISPAYYGLVTVLAIGGGILGWLMVLAVNWGKASLESRYHAYFFGYVLNNEKAWRSILKSSIADAIRFHGGGWAPLVRITTSSDSAKTGASKSSPSGTSSPPPGAAPPQVTRTMTNTTTNSTRVYAPDKAGSVAATGATTIEEVSETDATTSQVTEPVANPAPSTKESGIVGLLFSFDGVAPFDLVIGPQYSLTITVGSNPWKALKRIIRPPLPSDLDPDQAKGNLDIKKLQDRVNSTKWPRSFGDQIRSFMPEKVVNETSDSKQADPAPGKPETPPKATEGTGGSAGRGPGSKPQEPPAVGGVGLIGGLPVPNQSDELTVNKGALGIALDGPRWIKGSEVLSLEVLGARPVYLLRLEQPTASGK